MGGVEGVDSGAKDRLVEVIGCWPSQRPSERWPCAEKKGKRREGRVQCEAGKRNRLLLDFSQFVFLLQLMHVSSSLQNGLHICFNKVLQ